jgi:hypothetical protein
MKSTTVAPVRPLHEDIATSHTAPVDQKVATAILELDLEAAQRQGRRAGRLSDIAAQRKELAESKRSNRSTLDEIAASLGVSRSTANAMFGEPRARAGGRQAEQSGGESIRHAHGVGRRRHAGAGARRRQGRFHV